MWGPPPSMGAAEEGDGGHRVPGKEPWVHVHPQLTLPKLFPPASGHPGHLKPCEARLSKGALSRLYPLKMWGVTYVSVEADKRAGNSNRLLHVQGRLH